MQYTITVNQLAYQKHFPDLNFCHAAIVDWFTKFTHSPKVSRLDDDDNLYYWIDYENARKALPILGISNNDSMRLLIKALCNEKILELHPSNLRSHSHDRSGGSWIAFGDRYSLTFSEGDN
jgi:hypothetical protein